MEVDVIDLRQFPLPLYDADLQARDGIPLAAQEVADRIASTDAVLVANPEYNGGYSAVFKNTLDWVSRIDMLLFHPRYVGLLSATPGKKGGVRGLAHTADLFANIFVTTHPDHLGLPHANDVLGEEGITDPAESERVRRWTEEFLDGARAHRDERSSEVA